ncbi:hypothetical protein SmJEL517_g01523 [Synchytrium microbalum]|uniref:Cytochrome P450 n=1 Tax=Synchytrium microbalum TaxID=1806994 RepID=A0A507CDT9_9FUNG|nr:uncharacterized protein SmJEL517_g01523 [Synchytrium microbalum]TPX36206.1 hypothetical protein SmJEL517_g01523 [Synchytrium microbalum]
MAPVMNTQNLMYAAGGVAGALVLWYIISNDGKRHPPTVPFDLKRLAILKERKLSIQTHEDHKKLGPVLRFSFLGVDQYFVADAQACQRILAGPAQEFYRDDTLQNAFSGIAKMLLFAIPAGDQWARHRKLLSPSFSQIQVLHAFGETIKAVNTLLDIWKSHPRGTIVNLHYDFSMMALDVVGYTAEGKDSDGYHMVEKLSDKVMYRMVVPRFLWRFIGLENSSIADGSAYIREMITKVLEAKNASTTIKPDRQMDVLDRLLAKTDSGEARFTQEEVVDEIVGFYAAGHETTANTLTFCFAAMLLNPETKAKLVAEIDYVLRGAPPTYQDLGKLKYMDNFISEVQRFYAVVFMIPRRSRVDTELCGYHIPKNSLVLVNVFSTHRGSWNWGDDAEVFDPSRFDRPVPGGAFIPFGAGNMMCIGQRTALAEVKASMVVLLQNMDFELMPGQDFDPIIGVTQGLKKGLMVKTSPL